MKKIFCMTAVVLAVCLLSGIAFAAEATVTIGVAPSIDTSDVRKTETAINNALKAAKAGDVITVEGSLTNANNRINLNIPAEITVKWAAEFVLTAGVGAVYIGSSSAGVFEFADGGSITTTPAKPGIYGIKCDSRNATIKISGGTITVNGDGGIAVERNRGSAVEISGGTITATGVNVFGLHVGNDALVSGGTITVDGKDSFAVFSRGAITVTGGTIKAAGEESFALGTAAGGDITVSGGEVTGEVDSLGGKVVHTGGVINQQPQP